MSFNPCSQTTEHLSCVEFELYGFMSDEIQKTIQSCCRTITMFYERKLFPKPIEKVLIFGKLNLGFTVNVCILNTRVEVSETFSAD